MAIAQLARKPRVRRNYEAPGGPDFDHDQEQEDINLRSQRRSAKVLRLTCKHFHKTSLSVALSSMK